MQAVIPIAGRGKRMAETSPLPKQLIPVAGKPIIEYTLAALPDSIDELIFVVGGPHESAIRSYFGTTHGVRRVRYVVQEEPLGTAHALRCAAPLVVDKFLAFFPDDILEKESLKRLITVDDLGVLVARTDTPSHFGVLVVDDNNHVIDAVEKPKEFVSDLVHTGASLLDPEFFSVTTTPSARGEYETPDVLMALIRERQRTITAIHTSKWIPVNNPNELELAERHLFS